MTTKSVVNQSWVIDGAELHGRRKQKIFFLFFFIDIAIFTLYLGHLVVYPKRLTKSTFLEIRQYIDVVHKDKNRAGFSRSELVNRTSFIIARLSA